MINKSYATKLKKTINAKNRCSKTLTTSTFLKKGTANRANQRGYKLK